MISEFLDKYVGKWVSWLIDPTAKFLGKFVGDKYARDAAYLLYIIVIAVVAFTILKKKQG